MSLVNDLLVTMPGIIIEPLHDFIIDEFDVAPSTADAAVGIELWFSVDRPAELSGTKRDWWRR